MKYDNRQQLISALADDLQPVTRPGRFLGLGGTWLVANALISGLLLWMLGPFREGSFEQLAAHPQFLVESATGLAAVIALGIYAFRSAIPAMVTGWQSLMLPMGMLGLWLGIHLYGLWHPALEPGMAGKRDICIYETMLVGLPTMMIGVFALRRLWPVQRLQSGALLGLSAGAMPALLMQFACMYEPMHILTLHLLPGLMLGLVGAFVGIVALRRS